MQASKRLLAVYFLARKRLKVKGIRIDNESGEQIILSQPEDMQGALAKYWGELYAHKDGDYDAMSTLLTVYIRQQGRLFNFDASIVPAVEDDGASIRPAIHSASGPDGFPSVAYKADLELSAIVLRSALRDLFTESPRFN